MALAPWRGQGEALYQRTGVPLRWSSYPHSLPHYPTPLPQLHAAENPSSLLCHRQSRELSLSWPVLIVRKSSVWVPVFQDLTQLAC